MSTQVIHDILTQSQAGELIFPEVVRRLQAAGMESYFCVLAARAETFYMSNGDTHVGTMTLPPANIAEEFSSAGVLAAEWAQRKA